MRSNLVLFIEERLAGSGVDARVFVVFDQQAYYVYATRLNEQKHEIPLPGNWRTIMNADVRILDAEADADDAGKVPMVKMEFKRLEGVMLFLSTLIDDVHNKLKVELHCTGHFESSHNFKDLWAITGKGTELGVFDLDKMQSVEAFLRMLAHARVIEAEMIE